jgi:hypothetical protein
LQVESGFSVWHVPTISQYVGEPVKAQRLAATVADDYLATQRKRGKPLHMVARGGRVGSTTVIPVLKPSLRSKS